MQKSRSDNAKTAKLRVKEKLKYFFKETFRPHSKKEYAEVFTRGLGGLEKNTAQGLRKLPWLYIRVFALNLILFAIITVTFKLARYSADYLTAILVGGLLFNIPLFILLFELYPEKDLSILKLFAVILIGGIVSTAVITLGYEYIYSTVNEPNAWISTLWVGFWEELVKGAVGIVAILMFKKKNPFCCFLIGFAVGTGYSFFEDLGYIYSLSRSYGTAWLVLTSVGRGLSCVCSHAPWTAMICWAFAKFKKPFINFRFYGVVVAMMALHYFADVPFFDENLNILGGVTVGWAIEAVVVIAIFVIVFFALKDSFRELFAEGKPEFEKPAVLTERAKLSNAANLSAVLCAVAASAFALTGCAVKVGERNVYEKFYSDADFINCVQQDLPLSADWGREYVNSENGENDYTRYSVEGELLGATQKEEKDGYDYFYVYYFYEEQPVLENIAVNVENTIHYVHRIQVFENSLSDWYSYPRYVAVPDIPGIDDETPPVEEEPDVSEPIESEPEPTEPEKPIKELSCFYIYDGVSFGYDREENCLTLWTGETEFVGLAGAIALGALTGAALIGGCAAFITLKLKARRKENA